MLITTLRAGKEVFTSKPFFCFKKLCFQLKMHRDFAMRAAVCRPLSLAKFFILFVIFLQLYKDFWKQVFWSITLSFSQEQFKFFVYCNFTHITSIHFFYNSSTEKLIILFLLLLFFLIFTGQFPFNFINSKTDDFVFILRRRNVRFQPHNSVLLPFVARFEK